MFMKIYCYSKCSTCRKAKKWLDTRGVSYKEIAIRETPPAVDELQRMAAKWGMKRLFNTSGGDYRELKDEIASLDDSGKLELLSSRGNLVKRPFVVGDNVLLVGFKEHEWEDVF